MNSNIIREFENITKFSITDYFRDYVDFMREDYIHVDDYYSGVIKKLDSDIISRFKKLIKNSKTLLSQFRIFANKMQKCGFWELNEYCQQLNDTLEKITKLPKYKRVVKSYDGGYSKTVKTVGEIGGMKTIEDLSNETGANGIDEVSLILKNDLMEKDWEIDELKEISNFINNETDIVVTTIIGEPVGEKVYGVDIDRNITFSDNDLKLVLYTENISQKCEILLTLNKGDIPEFPEFGMTHTEGINSGNYNFGEFLKEINNNFMNNDIFKYVSINSMDLKGGSIEASVLIKTKYSYSQTSTVKI